MHPVSDTVATTCFVWHRHHAHSRHLRPVEITPLCRRARENQVSETPPRTSSLQPPPEYSASRPLCDGIRRPPTITTPVAAHRQAYPHREKARHASEPCRNRRNGCLRARMTGPARQNRPHRPGEVFGRVMLWIMAVRHARIMTFLHDLQNRKRQLPRS